MKIYLAGPMRGYPLFNFPAFFAAAEVLMADGHDVANPAAHDMAKGIDPSKPVDEAYNAEVFSLVEAFSWDFEQIRQAEAIVLLDGWRESAGAQAEVILGFNLGLDFYEYGPGGLTPIEVHEYGVEIITDADLRERGLILEAGGRAQTHTEAALDLTPAAREVIDGFFGSHVDDPDVIREALDS